VAPRLSRTKNALRPIYLSPWRIDFVVREGVKSPVPANELARLATRALRAAMAPSPASLGLILSDDEEMASLNQEHMGHEGPTDVLSFPLLPVSAFPRHAGQDAAARAAAPELAFVLPPGRRPHLGDIVVSVERAFEQAPQTPHDELRQLVVHGVLHICGWDHASDVERDAMRALERDVLAAD
jgi:probable rRNA maturation factor